MDINTSQVDTEQTSTSQINQGALTANKLVEIINNLLLIGAVLSVASTEDNVVITSAGIKLLAGFLSVGAALLESREQQIAPGVTTPLNRLKVAGSTISIIGALVLTYVLLQETRLRRAGIVPPSAQITPFISPAFV